MYIKYDEYELLEMFLNEPLEINGKEGGVFLYKSKNMNGFELSMYISIYEQLCCINLKHISLLNPVFDSTIYEVEKILKKENSLIIKKYNKDKIVIYFKPNISLKLEYADNNTK